MCLIKNKRTELKKKKKLLSEDQKKKKKKFWKKEDGMIDRTLGDFKLAWIIKFPQKPNALFTFKVSHDFFHKANT